MLSNKKIVCPNNLINIAKKKGVINVAIVNAGKIFPMESAHKAVQNNLINPSNDQSILTAGACIEQDSLDEIIKQKIKELRDSGAVGK